MISLGESNHHVSYMIYVNTLFDYVKWNFIMRNFPHEQSRAKGRLFIFLLNQEVHIRSPMRLH